MTKEEIEYGNKLLAEFMGIHMEKKCGLYGLYHKSGHPCMKWNGAWNEKKAWESFTDSKGELYHNSWSWLMPVLARIKKTAPVLSVTDMMPQDEIAYRIFRLSIFEPIESAFEYAVAYIEWFNKIQPK